MCVCFVYSVDLSHWMPHSKVAMDDEDDGPIDDAYIAAALTAPNTNKPPKGVTGGQKSDYDLNEANTGRTDIGRSMDPVTVDSSALITVGAVTSAWMSEKQPDRDAVDDRDECS